MQSLLPLLVVLLALRSSCDRAWVDPFDMTGDADEAPIDPERSALSQAAPHAKPTPPPPTSTNSACHSRPPGIAYKTFYRQLVHQLWTKVRTAHKRHGSRVLSADIRILHRAEHILDAFMNGESETVIQEVNEAFDSIFHAFHTPRNASSSTTPSWLDPQQLREALTYVILVFVLCFLLIPTFLIARSHFSGITRFFLVVFYLSWLWAWIVLYKKEVAARRSSNAKLVAACGEEEPWFVSFGHYLANYFVVVPDHCAELHRRLEVDPWLEVTPTRALVHMLTQTLLEPLRPMAEHLVHFVRTVSAGLPFLHAICAICAMFFVLVLVLTYAFGYRIRIPLLLAVEPAREHRNEVNEERLRALICSTMERHHSVMLERSLQLRRHSLRAEKIITRCRATGDGPLEEEEAAHSSSSVGDLEEAPETLE